MLQRPFVPMTLFATSGIHGGIGAQVTDSIIPLPYNHLYPAKAYDFPYVAYYSKKPGLTYFPITDTIYCADFNFKIVNGSGSEAGIYMRCEWMWAGGGPYGSNFLVAVKKGAYFSIDLWQISDTPDHGILYYKMLNYYYAQIPYVNYVRMYRVNGTVYFYVSRDGYNWVGLTSAPVPDIPPQNWINGQYYAGGPPAHLGPPPWYLDLGFYLNPRTATAVSFNSIEVISHG